MIILGIDPGIAIIGYGIIKNIKKRNESITYGTIETPTTLNTSERLQIIFDSIDQLIKIYNIDEIGIETIYYFKNQKTIIRVAEARGVILLAGQLNDIPIFEYTPLQIKQSIAGYGRAPKKQIQTMIKQMLGLTKIPKPDDAADGLAIALCHSSMKGFYKYNIENKR